MKIFISWSGDKSKRVAEALRDLIGDVMQATEPWMSPQISAGSWWSEILRKELSDARFGIVCVTRDNVNAPWLHFEAGAMAKAVDKKATTPICPYLIDLESTQLADSPLAGLQAKQATESGTLELIKTINEQLEDQKLPDEQLKRLFKRCYPELKSTLESLPNGETEPPREPDQMIEEILMTVRDLSRRAPPYEVSRLQLAWMVIEARLEAYGRLTQNDRSRLTSYLGIHPDEIERIIFEIQSMPPPPEGDF